MYSLIPWRPQIVRNILSPIVAENMLLTVLLSLCFIGQISSHLLLDSYQKWSHEISLNTGVEVKWNNEDKYYLTMEISAPTLGYVGVGFSPDGKMKGSDLIIGWVADGVTHIRDFFAIENGQPQQDLQQDVQLVAGSENEGRTTIRFRRRWDTCDDKEDALLNENTIRLIWAWHHSDPVTFPELSFSWHGAQTRGVRSVMLRIPSNPMKFPNNFYSEDPSSGHWDVTLKNIQITKRDSTFMCKIAKFPNGHKKYHLIGYEPIVTKDKKDLIQHITLYQCIVPSYFGGSSRIFEQHINQGSVECFLPTMPMEWGTFCNHYLFTWVMDNEGEMLPPNIGFPLGESPNEPSYYKLEVHFENPDGRSFRDSSGLRLIFTDQLREFDAGTMTIGHRVTPFHMVPHFQNEFRTYGICSKDCTKNGITYPNGIHLVAGTLQSHLVGKKMAVRHIRNGKELSPIMEDENIDFYYQKNRPFWNEPRVMPGDELIVECKYNTSNKQTITFGGLFPNDELCQAIITYYPKTEITDCRSQPEFYSFFKALGINNVSGSIFERMELPKISQKGQGYSLKWVFNNISRNSTQRITPPDNFYQILGLAESRMENPFDFSNIVNPKIFDSFSVGDYLRNMNWNDGDMSKQIEQSWKNGKHYMFCNGPDYNSIHIQKETTSFPKFLPYKRVDDRKSFCRFEKNSSVQLQLVLLIDKFITYLSLYYLFLNIIV